MNDDNFGDNYEVDHSGWAVLWPILAVVAILGLAAGAAMCQDSRPTTRKLIPPGPSLVDLKVHRLTTFTPTQTDEFTTWANAAARVLSERFEVPAPQWELIHERTPSYDCTEAKVYTPETETIRVYHKTPGGSQFSQEQMRYIWVHGFLHHLHKCRGVPHIPGHEREFDRWAKILGLIR